MTGLPPTLSDKENGPGGFAGLLMKVFASLAERLRKETFIFAMAMAILVIVALLISVELSNLIPFYVVVGALLLLTLMAFGAEYLSSRKIEVPRNNISRSIHETPKKGKAIKKQEIPMAQNDYMKLLHWLDKLNNNEFQIMVNALLKVSERNNLPMPSNLIDRGAFLGDMQVYERMDEVRAYLLENYPNRFDQQ